MAVPLPGCRVIVEPAPQSGEWNMAVDQVLLEAAVDRNTCSLRWYRWDHPTVSLGYFQDPNRTALPPQIRELPIVRRLSGGGAIIHDQELTYSCAVPATHPLAARPLELYTHVHQRVIETLAEFSITATLRGDTLTDRSTEFLCFGRGDAFDIVMGDAKVMGSAQRRRKGAILQHGSLILRRSRHAPEFTGILDLSATVAEPVELVSRLANHVARLLSDAPRHDDLQANELARAENLANEQLLQG